MRASQVATARLKAVVLAPVMLAALAGCGEFKTTPLWIEIDGDLMKACSGLVSIKSDETGIGVSFTDEYGIDHSFRGVKKLSTTEVSSERSTMCPRS